MRRPIFSKVKNIPVILSLAMLASSGMAQASHQHHERSRHKSSHSYHYGYFSHYTYPVIHGHHNTHASYLPLYISGLHYFYHSGSYYRHHHQHYVAVDAPASTTAQATTVADTTASQHIFVYPQRGQSAEQVDMDRFECHLWAVEQSGFDPSRDAGNSSSYRRASSACLAGRGYTVR